ncbi:hypothetical protein AGMMS50293_25460 [Spirochaetia bacterium]|nr:hypothetical protein AGMMS50293_25460 [Spirochaetia bacterium]
MKKLLIMIAAIAAALALGACSDPVGPVGPTLDHISVTRFPDKTIYNQGETFSTDGMTVAVFYDNSTFTAVTDYTLSWTGGELDTGNMAITADAGTKIVTVSWQGKSATFPIIVRYSDSKDITGFSFASPAATGTIDGTDISVSVPYGTDVTSLTPTVTHTGASYSPTGAQNFTNPVTYTVTAADGSTKEYTVTVTVALSDTKDITGFSFASLMITGTISGTDINITVPYGTDVTDLTPTVTHTGESYSPTGAQNFTNPQTYTVTAADGSTKNYAVTVTAALSDTKDITGFSFTSLMKTGTIDGMDISATVPYGTNITSLTPTVTHTGVSYSPTGAQDFTNPVTYTVTAANGSTKSYTVTVTVVVPISGDALWAKSVSAGSSLSGFTSVAKDSAGNVYAAGHQGGTGSYDYGNGVTVQGTSSGGNVVLVKYHSDGTAQWAKSVSGGSGNSIFESVAADSTGNVYAAGVQYGTGSYDYGNGVTVQGTSSGGNVVLVKYHSDGTAQWAKSVSGGSYESRFTSVAVDSAGNVYAAGYQYRTGSYDYGNGVTVQGTYSGSNVVLVKYNSGGTAQWAKSVSTGSFISHFTSVAVDSAGNVYAAGYQFGTDSYTYGPGITAAGTGSSNVVLVKYNSGGTAQWAKSVSAGSSNSIFESVAVDSAGNVYATGYQNGTGSYDYGNGKTVQGTNSGANVVLVKYNSGGTAQWAKSVSGGSSESRFTSVAVDSAGYVYAAGFQNGTGGYDYGTGVTAQGTYSGYNMVLVKYNSGGTAQWAKSVSAGSDRSYFNSVTADNVGNVYAAGNQWGTGSYTYGPDVTAQGTYSGSMGNVVLVKYKQ